MREWHCKQWLRVSILLYFLLRNLLENHLPFMNTTLITFFDNEIHKKTNHSFLSRIIGYWGFWNKFAQYWNRWFQYIHLALIYTNKWNSLKFCESLNGFLKHKQLKNLYTSMRICFQWRFTACMVLLTEIYLIFLLSFSVLIWIAKLKNCEYSQKNDLDWVFSNGYLKTVSWKIVKILNFPLPLKHISGHLSLKVAGECFHDNFD